MRKIFIFTCLSILLNTALQSQITLSGLKSIENKSIKHLKINETFEKQEKINKIFDEKAIYGISISGQIEFLDNTGFVKVILVSSDSIEYLVFEGSPQFYENSDIRLNDVCLESCILDSIVPINLIINVYKAKFQLETINIKSKKYNIDKHQLKIKQKEYDADALKSKIEKLNSYNKKNGLLWIAGETNISKLSYQEKKRVIGISDDSYLYGFEYYIGGIFQFPQNINTLKKNEPVDTLGFSSTSMISMTAQASSTYIDEFDWRTRHGANNNSSPYYDNDATGSGWLTSIKNQGSLGACWMFAGCGVTEAMTNLYFNQHIDLDLAEQDAVSCCSSCWGSPWAALNYIKTTGVVQESCFPYTQSRTTPCSDKLCSTNLTKITGVSKFDYSTKEKLKKMIVEDGPLSGTICPSGCHAMTLVGFGVVEEGDCIGIGSWNCTTIPAGHSSIGDNYWIFKNQWGSGWGESGYVRISISHSNITAYKATTPIINSNFTRRCVDLDGDGYYNWGIGDKPSTCPDCSLADMDCDDSNPNLGPMDANGNCTSITPYTYPTTYVTSSQTWSTNKNLCGNLVVKTGAILTITGETTIPYNSSVIVQENAQLKILGGKLINANITVKNGCHLLIDNNGIMELNGNDEMDIELGATFDYNYGEVNVNP